MTELLAELGLARLVGEPGADDTFVCDLEDSNDFGRVLSTLDSNEDLEYLEEISSLNGDNSNQVYMYMDLYEIFLIGDFEGDVYKLVITTL